MLVKRIFGLPYKVKITLCILFISGILLVPEMTFGGGAGFFGTDMGFHVFRYLDAAMQIKTGHFSYFQQFFVYNNSGRIINALYGPLFAYFQGFLLFLSGFHGIIWYILYCWLTNIVGMACMFYCLRASLIRPKIAILLSVFYVIAGSVNWQTTVGGYAIGYAFFPLIIAASLRLLKSDKKPVIVWELVLSLTVLAQTHMLSLLLGIVVYFFAFLYFSVKKFKSKIYLQAIRLLGLAALLFLLLNFNIYGGYLEVVLSNPNLVMPFELPQLVGYYTLDSSAAGFTQFPLFLALLLVACYFMTGKKIRSNSLDVKFALAVSILFSIFAFGLINLSIIPKITLFQFYSRFIVIAFPLGLFLIGKTLLQEEKAAVEGGKQPFHVAAYLVLVFTLVPYISTTTQRANSFSSKSFSVFANSVSAQDYFDVMTRPNLLLESSFYTEKLQGQISGQIDYVPNDSPFKAEEVKPNGVPRDTFASYFVNDIYKQASFTGTDLKRTVTSKGLKISWNSTKVQKTVLPILKYAHTKAALNGTELSDSEMSRSYVGALKIKAQTGENTLLVSYQPAKWFAYGIVMQLLSLLGVCVFIFARKNKVQKSIDDSGMK